MRNNNQNNYELISAILNNDLGTVIKEIQQKADINGTDENKFPIFFRAITKLNYSIIKAFIDKGVRKDLKDLNNNEALYYAIAYGNKEILSLLIVSGFNIVNNINLSNNAFILSDESTIKLLISEGFNTNIIHKQQQEEFHNTITSAQKSFQKKSNYRELLVNHLFIYRSPFCRNQRGNIFFDGIIQFLKESDIANMFSCLNKEMYNQETERMDYIMKIYEKDPNFELTIKFEKWINDYIETRKQNLIRSKLNDLIDDVEKISDNKTCYKSQSFFNNR